MPAGQYQKSLKSPGSLRPAPPSADVGNGDLGDLKLCWYRPVGICDIFKRDRTSNPTLTPPVLCASDNVSSGYPSAAQRSLYDDRTLYNYFAHLERLRATNPQLFTQQMTSYRCVK